MKEDVKLSGMKLTIQFPIKNTPYTVNKMEIDFNETGEQKASEVIENAVDIMEHVSKTIQEKKIVNNK